jgi:hypothetical protein
MKRLLQQHRGGEEGGGPRSSAFDFAAFVEDEDDDDLEEDGVDPFTQRQRLHEEPDRHQQTTIDEWENHPAPFDDQEFRDEDDDDRPSSSLLAHASDQGETVHGGGARDRQRAAQSSVNGDGEFNRKDEDGDGDEEQLELELDEEIKERSAREETRLKYRQTMVYCGTYLAQGLAGGCIGPTLLLLAANTSSEVDDMGLIFTIRGVRALSPHACMHACMHSLRTRTHNRTCLHSLTLTARARQLGWIMGSLCAGRLYESTGKRSHAVLFVATVAMAVFLFLFPFARSLWLLLALHAVNAFFASFNDVGANTLMFQVWQREVAPYMQFLHFSYGVGISHKQPSLSLSLCVCDAALRLIVSCAKRRVDVSAGHHRVGPPRGPVGRAAPLVSPSIQPALPSSCTADCTVCVGLPRVGV